MLLSSVGFGFLAQHNFGLKNVVENFLVLKQNFLPKKIWVRIFFYQIIFFHPKKFGSEFFLTQHFVGGIVLLTEKNWVKKNVHKFFWIENVFRPKQIWVGMFFTPKKLGRNF